MDPPKKTTAAGTDIATSMTFVLASCARDRASHDWRTRMANGMTRLPHLAVAIICTCIVPAAAQESRVTWHITQPAGNATAYATQQDAVRALASLPAPSPFPPALQFGWKSVNTIKSKTVSLDGTLSITYWMGKSAPLDPEWSYVSTAIFTTEEAMVAAMLADLEAGNRSCPGAAVTPTDEWHAAGPGLEGVSETRTFRMTRMTGDNTPMSPCEAHEWDQPFLRYRRLQCPLPLTRWSNTHGACVSEEFVATISTRAQRCDKDGASASCPSDEKEGQSTCDGTVGNPCNVKTGEKYEIAQDFDLGWVELTRFYHSGVSTSNGGFGHGWSHSLGMALLPDGPDSVGVIEGSGFQRAFKKDAHGYEADDASGDRLVQDGNWTLYSAGGTSVFAADGRLIEKQSVDGSSQTFVYDEHDRLAGVVHSSGRTLEFVYQSNDYDALISAILVEGVALARYTYTGQQQVATVTFADGGVRTYHYEDARFPQHLTGITAEDGRRYSSFAYDALGRVVSSQHAGGADGVTLAYGPHGGALVTDALGRQTDYRLTPGGDDAPPRKVTTVTDSQGTISRTYYDSSVDFRRRLDTYTDRRGVQTKHDYAQGVDVATGRPTRLHTVTEALGLPEQRSTTTAHDLEKNVLLTATTGQRETRVAYNARRQPVAVTITDVDTGQARSTRYTYCDESPTDECPLPGLLRRVDGPRTDVADSTVHAYYPADDTGCADGGQCHYRRGDLRRTTNALGQTTDYLAYDRFGRVQSIKDANGAVTDYSYHPRGWPQSITVRGRTPEEDRTLQFSYWPGGQVMQIIDPDGYRVTYVYDAAQRLTDIEDSSGGSIHYVLDAAGNRLREDVVDAGGTLQRTLSRTYNALGQLAQLRDARQYATGFTYDANGNLLTTTDALQRVKRQYHDALNRVQRVVQDEGGIAAVTAMTYNALDQVMQVTDPKGLFTTYAYNGLGDRIGQTSPDSGTQRFDVDAAGNPTQVTDARGVTARYRYDALDRLTGIVYPDPNQDVGYAYDVAPTACAANERFSRGRLAEVQHAGGRTLYCHDLVGNVTRKVQITGTSRSALRYAYTKAGRLSALTYPDGSVADYVRDAQGRIRQIGLSRAGLPRQIVVDDVTYAAFGPATGWTYGNGRRLQRPLDKDYRPQAVHDPAAGGLSVGFRYDAVGAISTLTHGTSPTRLAGFSYDALGRLTGTRDATDAPLVTYAYDATGNRTGLTTATSTAHYAYPHTSHRLSAVDGVAREHDAAGNTTRIGGNVFDYNSANRLAAVMHGSTAVERYVYNHRGERIMRMPVAGAAQVTLYDEAGRWIGNYSATGEPQQQAIWLDDHPVALMTAPAPGVPALAYVQPDHLGTPRVVIDSERDVAIWRWPLDGEAFGADAPEEDPDGDGVPYELNMRFPGQQYTAATGLYYNYQRDLDAASGRYVQSDPIGLAGGISTYGYVYGNPYALSDRFGLAPDPLKGYNPALGQIIEKTPTTPIHWSERIIISAVTKKLTLGTVSVGKLGGLRPAVQTLTSRYVFGIGAFLEPTEMGCAELDCDRNGFIDFMERDPNTCLAPGAGLVNMKTDSVGERSASW